MEKSPILRLDNITKFHGSQSILYDVNFQVSSPQIIALVAPNGTGKTTLLNVIANIEKADEGTVTIFGKNNSNHTIFRDMAYLQDNTILYAHLTGYDHLLFVAKEHRLPQADLDTLIDKIGIRHYLKKRINQYSLGMKQHLLLAIALVNEPKLLLLDEPLNGLDPDSVNLVRRLLFELRDAGTTVILSSHNLDEVERMADNIFFLVDETLLNSREVIVNSAEYLLIIEDTNLIKAYASQKNITFHQLNEHKLSLTISKEQLKNLQAFCVDKQIKLFDISLAEGELKNAYFQLYHKGGSHESV